MRSLWPKPPDGELTDADLERIYAYPEPLTRPWVQVNFVASADGAVTVGARSEGLSHPADKRIFLLGRDLADVVLVGAGTVRAKNYSGVKVGAARAERRARLGRSPVPPVAVVTGGAAIDPDHPVITETRVPTVIITTGRAPADRVAALTDAGARVLVAGERKVDLATALALLAELGLHRIDCEGGPHLFGELIADDLVDQLCLTVAPMLAGAGAGRIALGRASGVPRSLELASLLQEEGYTMLRYRRRADTAGRGSG